MLSMQKIDEAMEIVNDLEDFADRSGGMWCLSDVYILKARVLLASGEREQAKQSLMLAEQQSRQIGSKRGQLNALGACIENLSERWDDGQTQEFARRADELLNYFETQIKDEELKQTFRASPQALRISDWLASVR
jgi:hypothetical protein